MLIDGVEVCVKSVATGETYKEYADPDGGPRSCFIESTPGEKFTVDVKLQPYFKWHGAPGFDCEQSIGKDYTRNYWIGKPPPDSTHKSFYVWSDISYEENGKWKRGNLAFAEYALDDNEPETTQPGAGKNHQDLAKITFKLHRAHKLGASQNPVPLSNTFVSSTKASIKQVKKSGIGHLVQPANVESFVPTPRKSVTVDRCKGDAGRAIDFTFKYRPKYALRKLGICPPSPVITATEAVDLTELSDGDSDDDNNVTEVVDLTSRNVRVKRERSVEDDDIEAELQAVRDRQRHLEERLKRKQSGENGRQTRSATVKIEKSADK